MREEIKIRLLLNIFEEVTRKYEELLRMYEDLNEFLKYKASHDPLTGLYNREALENILKAQITKTELLRNTVSVIFLDIDNFKKINDTFGHQFGDEILKKIGEIIKNSVRERDIVARYGGDEFVIILHTRTDLEPKIIANRIKERIEREFHPYNLSVSYGIAVAGKDGSTHEELIKVADERMYKQKAEKKLKSREVS